MEYIVMWEAKRFNQPTTSTTTRTWANTTTGNYNYDYDEINMTVSSSVSTISTSSSDLIANTTRKRRRNAGGGGSNTMDASDYINLILTYYRAFGLPLVIFIGVFGNCFVLYIFSRHSVGVSRSTRVYYVLLALVDCTSLLTYNLAQFLSYGLNTISARTFNIKIETF